MIKGPAWAIHTPFHPAYHSSPPPSQEAPLGFCCRSCPKNRPPLPPSEVPVPTITPLLPTSQPSSSLPRVLSLPPPQLSPFHSSKQCCTFPNVSSPPPITTLNPSVPLFFSSAQTFPTTSATAKLVNPMSLLPPTSSVSTSLVGSEVLPSHAPLQAPREPFRS